MQIFESVSIGELEGMAEQMYGELVKGVVDITRRVIAFDAELHADEEELLLLDGSNQADLWGFNVYPEDYGTDDFIEFDSMINIRPSQGNRSRSVEDPETQRLIREIVAEVVHG